VKILAISDVESKYLWEYFDPRPFAGTDLIISCGDLNPNYLSFLVTMIPAPLMYVYGNHDKGYERNPPLGCRCIDGELVVYRGVRILGLGGCLGMAPAPYEHTEKQMLRRIKRVSSSIRKAGGIDILVSHAPAAGLGDGGDQYHMGFQALRMIDEQYQPALHLFGHKHMSGSPVARANVLTLGDTTLVNATGYRIIEFDERRSKLLV
jgi:Icc-related predicted phosphoesterase